MHDVKCSGQAGKNNQVKKAKISGAAVAFDCFTFAECDFKRAHKKPAFYRQQKTETRLLSVPGKKKETKSLT